MREAGKPGLIGRVTPRHYAVPRGWVLALGEAGMAQCVSRHMTVVLIFVRTTFQAPGL